MKLSLMGPIDGTNSQSPGVDINLMYWIIRADFNMLPVDGSKGNFRNVPFLRAKRDYAKRAVRVSVS
jgi:hypothetical protein